MPDANDLAALARARARRRRHRRHRRRRLRRGPRAAPVRRDGSTLEQVLFLARAEYAGVPAVVVAYETGGGERRVAALALTDCDRVWPTSHSDQGAGVGRRRSVLWPRPQHAQPATASAMPGPRPHGGGVRPRPEEIHAAHSRAAAAMAPARAPSTRARRPDQSQQHLGHGDARAPVRRPTGAGPRSRTRPAAPRRGRTAAPSRAPRAGPATTARADAVTQGSACAESSRRPRLSFGLIATLPRHGRPGSDLTDRRSSRSRRPWAPTGRRRPPTPIVRVVDQVKGKTTDRAVIVGRADRVRVCWPRCSVALALVLVAILTVRFLDAYLPDAVFGEQHTWAAHGLIGALFVLVGVVLWSRRHASPS